MSTTFVLRFSLGVLEGPSRSGCKRHQTFSLTTWTSLDCRQQVSKETSTAQQKALFHRGSYIAGAASKNALEDPISGDVMICLSLCSVGESPYPVISGRPGALVYVLVLVQTGVCSRASLHSLSGWNLMLPNHDTFNVRRQVGET